MLEIINAVYPSPEQCEIVVSGSRNAYKSWDRSDSFICWDNDEYWKTDDICNKCKFNEKCKTESNNGDVFVLGENDERLLENLCHAGETSHRKFLRQLPVIFDIRAPLYFWKQLDTYKVGTTANSESTMHTLVNEPFTIDDFSMENFLSLNMEDVNYLECFEYDDSEYDFGGISFDGQLVEQGQYLSELYINLLNSLRYFYFKTSDKRYWHAINELLPQSYMQSRTWSANYEVLLKIMTQRIHHKLAEWRTLIVFWLKSVPYLLKFACAAGIVKVKGRKVLIADTGEHLYDLPEIY